MLQGEFLGSSTFLLRSLVFRGAVARGARKAPGVQEGFDRRVRMRVRRAVGPLRGLWRGRLNLAEVSGGGPTLASEWAQASPCQRRHVRDLAAEHAHQERVPCCLSDVECFHKVTGVAAQAYPEAVKGLDRDAMCPAVVDEVPLPAAINQPIAPQLFPPESLRLLQQG